MSENKATKAEKDEKIEAQKEEEIEQEIKEVTSSQVSDEGKAPVADAPQRSDNRPYQKNQGKGGGGKPFFRGRPREEEKKEFEEKIIAIDRVTRVVKGGRRMRFRALVVIGDKKGRVGYATGKGNEVTVAVSKAVSQAKKKLVSVNVATGTIPHDIIGKSRSTKVLLKSAKEGRGIIAGGSVRTVLELAGYSNIVAKSYGSNNKISNVMATIDGLTSLFDFSGRKTYSKAAPKVKDTPEVKEKSDSKKVEDN